MVAIPETLSSNEAVYNKVRVVDVAPGRVTVAVGATVSMVVVVENMFEVGPALLAASVTPLELNLISTVPSVEQVTAMVTDVPDEADGVPVVQLAVPV